MRGNVMNAIRKKEAVPAGTALVLLVLLLGSRERPAHAQQDGTASLTIVVPAGAQLFVDGKRMTQTGKERRFTSPELPQGKEYHYNLLARWQENGSVVERTRTVTISAGARLRVSFLEEPKEDDTKGKEDNTKGKEKDRQVMTTKATRRVAASSVNFRKELGLPFHSLGTLGARIDAARRKPDPVALAHAASELSVSEKVAKKQASVTAKMLLAESAQLAALRRQVAELKAVFAVHQQIANEDTDINYWNTQIGLADGIAKQESRAVLKNSLPTDAPRKVVLNNYTTQYIDLWVNGYLKMQIPPGGSSWCLVELRVNPVTMTAYGNADDAVWGPRQIYGAFTTYTWNLQ
jgi:uncharacterized protein (TIGR03000 family)